MTNWAKSFFILFIIGLLIYRCFEIGKVAMHIISSVKNLLNDKKYEEEGIYWQVMQRIEYIFSIFMDVKHIYK